MARTTSLPERHERIESELADGIPIAIVAQNVGIGRSTLHEWLSSGRVVRHSRPMKPLEVVREFCRRLHGRVDKRS